ncbi:MAG: hypothetical protein KAS32_18410 [Candidatus Peribacteraceae bacterium]|nr:hypothetical protein [Candidatus Peribacteraceae bacterium]
MDKKTRELLLKPITEHKKPGAGGRSFSYIKGEDVIGRLNTVFKNDWSSKIIQHWTIEGATKQIMVLVELEAGGIVHQGFGGADIAVYSGGNRKGEIIDISSSYKSSLTNAIKNAAKQFSIGLSTPEAEAFKAEPVKSTTPVNHSAPTTPSSVPTGPVSGSAGFSTQSNTPANVDLDALQKQVRDVLAAASVPPVVPTPKPVSSESFAKTFKDIPNEIKQPEVVNPFPTTPSDTLLNDFQLNALSGLAKMKKVIPSEAIKNGLPESTKTKYEELTKDEAKSVIRALNNLKG